MADGTIRSNKGAGSDFGMTIYNSVISHNSWSANYRLRMHDRAHPNMNGPNYNCAVFNNSLDILRPQICIELGHGRKQIA
jgi:hypothetical protein